MQGVSRRMLERDGDEVARVTSIVRYEPESSFSPHTHSGGEEFLVLDGVFSDEHGDCPAGTYVRNPVGSKHTPFTKSGCSILVKLWWMFPEDQSQLRINTSDAALWKSFDGIETLHLHSFRSERTYMLRMSPGSTLKGTVPVGGREFFVVDGSVNDGNDTHEANGWCRIPASNEMSSSLTSESGAVLFMKAGSLTELPPMPHIDHSE